MGGDKSIIFRQIGAKVAYYRTLRNLTQDELARSIHVSKSTIGRVERGTYNQNVSIALLLDIADGLHVDLAFLVTFSEQEKTFWQEKEGMRKRR